MKMKRKLIHVGASCLGALSLAGAVLALNPMTPIIDAYRAVLLRGELPPATPFAYATILAALTLAVGWLLFHRAEFRFAESI